ncbi:VOC family protein [Streptomyces sp. Y7]|uniref:VOC family protein n=1 Tax=Streptomyces sp. Y7 TaxID=3342392 RepID=UPI0037212447
MASVLSLGYVIVSTTDVPAWKSFAVDLLGLQAAEESADRLLLRMDEKAYRVDVRRDTRESVQTLGWEVAGPEELKELAGEVEAAGYPVKVCDESEVRARMVSGLVQFQDPDGTTIELFYGLKTDKERFVSPTGATFLTGHEGFGHALQMVGDTEAYRHLYVDVFGFRLSDYIEIAPGLTATFLHCNSRHHSFAFASFPNVPRTVNHLMFEVNDLDLVGRAYDKVLAGAAPVAATFGRHTNDGMLSFYARTPSGFDVEYGYGGLHIDEATFTPSRYDVTSYWGHKPSNPDELNV